MKTTIAGLLALGLVVMASGAGAVSEVRDVTGFDRVVFTLPGKLRLERGDAHEVVVDAAQEDLDRIVTEVRGNELTVRWKEGPLGVFSFGGRAAGPISVQVTLPELRALEVAGSGEVEGGNWLSESLHVEVNGSGGVRFGEIATEELTLELAGSGSVSVTKVDSALVRLEVSGSGGVELAGAADRQEIEVMGSGDVDAARLEGARVDVEIMGSGDVSVWANEALSAEIMGSGDVRYRGSPRVETEQHGSGRVRPL